jgi:hypothetical protein
VRWVTRGHARRWERPLVLVGRSAARRDGRVLVRFATFRPERVVVRPNGPAVPPARVAGPGGFPTTFRQALRADRSPKPVGQRRRIVVSLGDTVWRGTAGDGCFPVSVVGTRAV